MSRQTPALRRKRDRLQNLLAWTHAQPHVSGVRLPNKGEDDLSANEPNERDLIFVNKPKNTNSIIPSDVSSPVSQDHYQSREFFCCETDGANIPFLAIPERSSSYGVTGESWIAALRTATAAGLMRS